ncbi:MAG TPA: PIN domain-containing protein [Opitutales bacterium]|jgi:uncharacterized protein YacL|nr:PIN domain-containing protein [Opitutales bacterium]
MNRTFQIVRASFFALCLLGGWLVWVAQGVNADRKDLWLFLAIGGGIGALTILVDIFLKGFSLRSMTAVTFGLAMGILVASLISHSPFFDVANADVNMLFRVRVIIFVVTLYITTVMAMRGRDEFNVVIPYVRFVPQEVASMLVVADASALIDGRVLGVCQSHFLGGTLVVPRFVIEELNRVADSPDPQRQSRGRRGLEVLNELRRVPGFELRVHDVTLENRQQMDDKLIFVARSLKARLLTTDYNLAKLAEFHDVQWLNLNKLARALHPEVTVGDCFSVELVKPGKEAGQAVGYLGDGSMVVVNEAEKHIGRELDVEVVNVVPSAGGKMVFARLIANSNRPARA